MRPQKRSFSIRGHRTSISLEAPFWQALREIASHRAIPLAALVAEIDEGRGDTGLSTAVRLHVLHALQARLRDCQSAQPGTET
ncbi:MAG: ribbon-helix-helix domain-containing protein [Hyphomicrobiaceae bacterium]|nr:ribbon-helix-helix domain-containing protein [Hyphomicrobiaceae bacterium]MCC0008298.1 ribbon-helix-helix domain-containing protein [Hyphomicrobiaceae bacterium]